MNLYIKGLGCVSPQRTFGLVSFNETALVPEGDHFSCVEPQYRDYIDPKISRRMSRIIKMGIASAKMALAEGGVSVPDAIITGTGLGCVADTSQFLDDIIASNEGMCSPTAFIQSTHNTISSQIAIHLSCHGYNSTYVHRAHSFESALMDASLRIADGAAATVLTGGVDEMTPRLAGLARGMGLSRAASDDSGKGFVPGEGAVFALLSGKPEGGIGVRLAALRFGSNLGVDDINSLCEDALREAGISPDAVDCVIDGRNGDAALDSAYNGAGSIIARDFPRAIRVPYKRYCGEYFTAPAFSLWLAARALSEGTLPSHSDPSGKKMRVILIFNMMGDSYFSVMVMANEQTQ